MEIVDIERAIITKYRAKLYRPFVKGILDYELINNGDVIGVCISGGKDSLLLAKLLQEYQKHGGVNFDLKFISMNPGFNNFNLDNLKINCDLMGIPVVIKNSDIFKVSQKLNGNKPCYLCAKMRRGFLYDFAKEVGCNKIALAHHLNDVIETILLNVLYTGNYGSMMPKLKSQNFEGMELIRPLTYVYEKDIIRYMKHININAMSCGCDVSEREDSSKRKEIKKLISELKKVNPNVEMSIYRSAENVNLNTVISWKDKENKISFLDNYDKES